MKVFELSFGCYVYSKMTDYDKSYLEFQQVVSNPPDLSLEIERQSLLTWLNQWGCRQFAKEYHPKASSEINKWFAQYASRIASTSKELRLLTESDFAETEKAFTDLSESVASMRRENDGKTIPVNIGPTGAAKNLFALRPMAYPPWDIPIREKLILDGSGHSYIAYMKHIQSELTELEIDCDRLGLRITELPIKMNRPSSTIAKVVDEFYWVTISKGCSSPDKELMSSWIAWQ
jgi:hypothetical protein